MNTRLVGGLRRIFHLAPDLSVIAVVIVMTMAHLAPGANAQEAAMARESNGQSDWSKDAATIDRLLSNRQCDEAWKLLLKHINTGNRLALAKTAGAVGAVHGPGLRLPGAPTDGFSSIRLMTIFAALSLDAPDSWVAQSARNFLVLSMFGLPPCGKNFDAAACHKLLLEQNIVPAREEFLKEIAGYQSAARTGAVCVGPQ